jgi:nucleoside-diphosphate-sugar epimerase
MRVLVTGATGFVGSHTAVALLEAGHEVRCLVRSQEKLERVFAAHELPAPESLVGDIVDAGSVKEALSGVDAVVHSAAVVAMQAHRAREILETNARGAENVVGGAVEAGIGPIVYVSSTGALFVPDGPRMTEDSAVQEGKNPYARSKSDGELYVRRLQAEGAPIASTLPTSILGPLDPGLSEANHALRTFARDLVLLTSGYFSVVDVRDLAQVHVKLVEREPAPGRYVVSAADMTWEEIGDGVDAATGVKARRLKIGGAPLRVGGRIADVIKRFWDFDFPITTEGMMYATQFPGADGSRTAEALGIAYREPVETFADALRWMHEAGHIPAKHVGRLAGG